MGDQHAIILPASSPREADMPMNEAVTPDVVCCLGSQANARSVMQPFLSLPGGRTASNDHDCLVGSESGGSLGHRDESCPFEIAAASRMENRPNQMGNYLRQGGVSRVTGKIHGNGKR